MNILHTADWHLGHMKVSTESIVSRIRKYMFPYIEDTDVMFIVGDIFDGVVNLNSEDATHVIELFTDLLTMCHKFDVVLRVVQGTFSHDRRQLNVLQTVYNKLRLKFDFKIFTNLHVEVHSKFSALYMPDNLPYKSKSDMFKSVRDLLVSANLTKVDLCCVHGEFDFASHHFVSHDTLKPSDFKNIVKGDILCGHIHTPYKRGRVIYAGSFDRLRHNEESKRGFWVYRGKWEFIENTDATRFITVELDKDIDLESAIEIIGDVVKTKFTEAYGSLRVKLADAELAQSIRQFMNRTYPHIHFQKGRAEATKKEVVDMVFDEELVEPNAKTLPKLLSEHIPELTLEELEVILNE